MISIQFIISIQEATYSLLNFKFIENLEHVENLKSNQEYFYVPKLKPHCCSCVLSFLVPVKFLLSVFSHTCGKNTQGMVLEVLFT